MYVPAWSRIDDAKRLFALIREHSFGTLVTTAEGVPAASHLPFSVDAEEAAGSGRPVLLGHLARANPHWRSWGEETEALVIFQGPHGYVSPRWYSVSPAVPTWNYVAVHAVGRLRLIEEPDALRALVGRLAAAYEGDTADAWSLERIPEAFASSLLDHIVGFEIPIDRLEGKAKLSQNRAEADRRGVIEALRAGAAPADAALADVMDAAMR